MQQWLRFLVVPLVVCFTGLAAPASPAFAQNQSSVVPRPPTIPICGNPGIGAPCFADVTDSGTNDGAQFQCSHQVPLLLRAGGVKCVDNGDLVLITCYFQGSPAVGGDNFQDHVTGIREDDGTSVSAVGHVPDFFVDFGGKTPNQVGGIPGC
jgi:hypothetical protein